MKPLASLVVGQCSAFTEQNLRSELLCLVQNFETMISTSYPLKIETATLLVPSSQCEVVSSLKSHNHKLRDLLSANNNTSLHLR